ncbi:hypothetical protein BX600DRAFT_465074 [Xylariales sp. PMI_506]|nr:hypothetical protein BX600DRAFT_465074 [Xylariales sp. PMI_506]
MICFLLLFFSFHKSSRSSGEINSLGLPHPNTMVGFCFHRKKHPRHTRSEDMAPFMEPVDESEVDKVWWSKEVTSNCVGLRIFKKTSKGENSCQELRFAPTLLGAWDMSPRFNGFPPPSVTLALLEQLCDPSRTSMAARGL